jgi:hypothetical protein
MHYLEQHNKTGLLLLVDFEKAFDSVEWKFLKKALSSFNFGPFVCKWLFSLPSRIRKVSSAYKLVRDSTSLIIIP